MSKRRVKRKKCATCTYWNGLGFSTGNCTWGDSNMPNSLRGEFIRKTMHDDGCECVTYEER